MGGAWWPHVDVCRHVWWPVRMFLVCGRVMIIEGWCVRRGMGQRRVTRLLVMFCLGAVLGLALWFVQHSLITNVSGDEPDGSGELDRNAAYLGSMTMAAAVMFGSAFLAHTDRVTKTTPRARRIGTAALMAGSFLMASTHLVFAGLMCCNDPEPHLLWLTTLSVSFMSVIVYSYVYLMTSPRQASGWSRGNARPIR